MLVVLLGLPLGVSASTVDAVSQPTDPVAATSCSWSDQVAHVTVGDRTRHDLLSLTLHIIDYDANAKQIGGAEASYSPSPALTGGQSARYDVPVEDIPLFAGSTKDQVARQTCDVESAVLSGNHIWANGQKWAESLVDAAPPSASAPAAKMPALKNAGGQAPDETRPGPVSNMTVLMSWTTPGQNITYLHVRVNMHPANTVLTQASDFRLMTTSHTGGTETEYGLNQSAPTYQKVNTVSGFLAAMNKQATPAPTTAATVTESEDLGAHGKIQVIGGDPITDVVTFIVRPDTDVDPTKIAASLQWLAVP